MHSRADRYSLLPLYLTAFAVRFAAGMLAWLSTRYVGYAFWGDGGTYELWGSVVANEWIQYGTSNWLMSAVDDGTRPWTMVGFVAVVYWLTGGIRAIPLLIALYCLISALAPVAVYKCAERAGAPPEAARLAAWIIALSPTFALWSGALYKEGFILVLLPAAAYFTLQLLERIRLPAVLLLTGCVFLLGGLRFYLAFLVGAAALLSITLLPIGSRRARIGSGSLAHARQLFIAACLAIGASLTGITAKFQRLMPQETSELLVRVSSSRENLATANSGFLRGRQLSTPADVVRNVPVGLVYFMSVPLPWHIGTLRQNMAIPESFLWLLLYPVAAFGIFAALKKNARATITLLLPTAGIAVFYAILVANMGTVYRLRTQVWAILAIFIAWGWVELRTRRKRRFDEKLVRSMLPAGGRASALPSPSLPRGHA